MSKKIIDDFTNKVNDEIKRALKNKEKFEIDIPFKIWDGLSLFSQEENQIYQIMNLKDKNSGTDLTEIFDFKLYPEDMKEKVKNPLDYKVKNSLDNDPIPSVDELNQTIKSSKAKKFNFTEDLGEKIILSQSILEKLTFSAVDCMYDTFLSFFQDKLSSLEWMKAKENQDDKKMNLYHYSECKDIVKNLKLNGNKMIMLTSSGSWMNYLSGKKKEAFDYLKNELSHQSMQIPGLKDGVVYLGDFKSIFQVKVYSSYRISIDFKILTTAHFDFYKFTCFFFFKSFDNLNLQKSIAKIDFHDYVNDYVRIL